MKQPQSTGVGEPAASTIPPAPASSNSPLSHIRVLDLSRVLAGPWASQALADLGAQVIKIERPGAGDDTRTWGPPWVLEPTAQEAGISAYFACANRGKKSVEIDITSQAGQEAVRRLAVISDVLIENYKVGGLAKYGLDHASLKALNPRLVYCSITGFGQSGPYAERAGYDFLVQGMGGLMSITGEVGGGPLKVGVAISDLISGHYALAGILTALIARDRTGEGAHIDIALLDATIASLANQGSSYHITGRVPGPIGNAHPTIVPYQAFASADGHLVLAIGNDGQFARFCEVAGLAELSADARYATNAARVANRASLIPVLAARLGERTTANWVAALENAAVPCGPINRLDEVFADPHVRARGLARPLEHASLGPITVTCNPIRLDGQDQTSSLAPPRLGQDTADVLRDLLGYDDAAIAALSGAGEA